MVLRLLSADDETAPQPEGAEVVQLLVELGVTLRDKYKIDGATETLEGLQRVVPSLFRHAEADAIFALIGRTAMKIVSQIDMVAMLRGEATPEPPPA